jgi:hypothetical protein
LITICDKESPRRHGDTEKNIELITWLFCSVPRCLCGDPCLRTGGRARIPGGIHDLLRCDEGKGWMPVFAGVTWA